MGYAFISYSSKNRAFTDKLTYIFSKYNIESWVAPDDIPAGSEYAGVINKAIKNCSCLVLLLTNDSMHSQWVAKEVERAINYKKPIIPVQLEDVVLNDQFELYISTNQILRISNLDESAPEVQSLISVVQRHTRASSYKKQTLQMETMHDFKPAEDMPSPAPSWQPQPAQKAKPNLMPIILVAICVVAVLAAVSLIPRLTGGNDNSSLDTPGAGINTTTQGTTEATEASTEPSTTPDAETTQAPSTNEIPSVYENKITDLKGASELALRNSTIRVKVGQCVIPPAAQVWTDATIYSQDTSIAVGEDTAIKGVSKGETYIILEATLGMAVAYYVIVE